MRRNYEWVKPNHNESRIPAAFWKWLGNAIFGIVLAMLTITTAVVLLEACARG